MKKRLVVAAIMVGLVAVLAAGAFGVRWILESNRSMERVEAARDAASAAKKVDDKLAAIWDGLAALDAKWLSTAGDEAAMQAECAASGEEIAALQGDVEDARTVAEAIPEAELKTAYVAVCDELRDVLKKVAKDTEATTPLVDALVAIETVSGENDAGHELLNASVLACNKRDFRTGEQKANEAAAKYQAVRDAFTQAASLSGLEPVSAATQYLDSQILVAQYQAEWARFGAKGRIAAYNAQIDKIDAQEQQSSSLNHLVGEAVNVLVDKIDVTHASAEGKATHAENLWDKARELARQKQKAVAGE